MSERKTSGFVGIGTATPVNTLDIGGKNQWDLSTTEGDVRIGNPTYRLKIGVATEVEVQVMLVFMLRWYKPHNSRRKYK